MKETIRKVLGKLALTVLPDADWLRHIAYRPKLESWLKSRATQSYPRFDSRTQIYDYVNKEILANQSIHYLEFGVYKGESIKYFANINTHRDSRLVGFDTFTGLPEDWGVRVFETMTSATFDTRGEAPPTKDPRISFVKGLFQDTLPAFLNGFKPVGPLVIHNDSDLYSSSLYLLTCLNSVMIPGTIVIFDEFTSVLHEFRALDDYCSACIRKYDVIAATRDHGQIAIRML